MAIDKMIGKEARWQIYKDAACYTESILKIAPYTKKICMAIYRPSHKSFDVEEQDLHCVPEEIRMFINDVLL